MKKFVDFFVASNKADVAIADPTALFSALSPL